MSVYAGAIFVHSSRMVKCNEQCKSLVCKRCKMLYDLKAQDFILFIYFYYFFFVRDLACIVQQRMEDSNKIKLKWKSLDRNILHALV